MKCKSLPQKMVKHYSIMCIQRYLFILRIFFFIFIFYLFIFSLFLCIYCECVLFDSWLRCSVYLIFMFSSMCSTIITTHLIRWTKKEFLEKIFSLYDGLVCTLKRSDAFIWIEQSFFALSIHFCPFKKSTVWNWFLKALQ